MQPEPEGGDVALSRFPTGTAIRSVTEALGLDPELVTSQSWALEASAPDRAEELAAALEDRTWSPEETVALAALVLASVDDRLQLGQPLEPSAEAGLTASLRERRGVLGELLEYWACLDAEDPDELFAASWLARRAIGRID